MENKEPQQKKGEICSDAQQHQAGAQTKSAQMNTWWNWDSLPHSWIINKNGICGMAQNLPVKIQKEV